MKTYIRFILLSLSVGLLTLPLSAAETGDNLPARLGVGVHLGFNHSKFAAQFIECGGSLFAVGGQNPALNRQTIARKQLFCLIFM